ncbi:MAG: hypothetical protein H6732_07500 [Alphaproteobacteria bacterium]|nr:hypothetical protein [Alphaproteobacteria bacterium]
MSGLLLGLLVLGTVRAQEVACTAPASTLELVQAAARAEEAYRALLAGEDEEGAWRALHGEVQGLRRALPCAGVALTPALAARVHLALGLEAFAAARPEEAELAFAASRRAAGTADLPSWLAPTDPEARAFAALPLELGWEVEVAAPRRGRLLWDGVPGLHRPGPWPVVVQLEHEGVRFTRLVAAADPLPVYPRRAPRAAWALVGGGAALVALGVGLGAAGGAEFAAACASQPGQACVDHGSRTGDEVAASVEALVDAGLLAAAAGVAVAVGGGVWLAVGARPTAAAVGVGSRF